jgi:hypothetical protein
VFDQNRKFDYCMMMQSMNYNGRKSVRNNAEYVREINVSPSQAKGSASRMDDQPFKVIMFAYDLA